MKLGFYPRLAWDGIRKNKRLYLPFTCTCTGMVLMTYIINYLKWAPAVAALPGGGTVQIFMTIGVAVITFFAAIFLFYTNSFLMKRRKKEFGLYHILGMGKANLSRILFWETAIIAAVSLAAGLLLGIALSKVAELGIVNILDGQITYTLTLSPAAVRYTVLSYLVIFALLLLNGLRQVWFSSAISLLRSENVGEKPPKANWLLGLGGAVLLAGAYYLAVTIQDPISAIGAFYLAVLMVIAGTYLLMIAGSVLLCRVLQKNKGYYYQPRHFVSLSSMVYRMKRNGAGLASICILATMVLVMLSSTSALFIGGNEVIFNRYPRELNICFRAADRVIAQEEVDALEPELRGVLDEQGVTPRNLITYRTTVTAGLLDGGTVIYDPQSVDGMDLSAFANVHQIYIIPLSDYNRSMGTAETLGPDEVLIYAHRGTFHADTFCFVGQKEYRVKALLDEFFSNPDAAMDICPSLMVVAADPAALVQGVEDTFLNSRWYFSFDTNLSDKEDIALYHTLEEMEDTLTPAGMSMLAESRAYETDDFYSLYGGLFYLGLLLSLVFLTAAVLIIYYKQVSEGYEDQSRFDIMQKVGMTRSDIRRSINSQLRTVFFLPLGLAGLHLAFAFPIIEKLLLLFNLNNHRLFVGTTLGSFLIFGIFYTVVYRITSNAYYHIVSGASCAGGNVAR